MTMLNWQKKSKKSWKSWKYDREPDTHLSVLHSIHIDYWNRLCHFCKSGHLRKVSFLLCVQGLPVSNRKSRPLAFKCYNSQCSFHRPNVKTKLNIAYFVFNFNAHTHRNCHHENIHFYNCFIQRWCYEATMRRIPPSSAIDPPLHWHAAEPCGWNSDWCRATCRPNPHRPLTRYRRLCSPCTTLGGEGGGAAPRGNPLAKCCGGGGDWLECHHQHPLPCCHGDDDDYDDWSLADSSLEVVAAGADAMMHRGYRKEHMLCCLR